MGRWDCSNHHAVHTYAQTSARGSMHAHQHISYEAECFACRRWWQSRAWPACDVAPCGAWVVCCPRSQFCPPAMPRSSMSEAPVHICLLPETPSEAVLASPHCMLASCISSSGRCQGCITFRPSKHESSSVPCAQAQFTIAQQTCTEHSRPVMQVHPAFTVPGAA